MVVPLCRRLSDTGYRRGLHCTQQGSSRDQEAQEHVHWMRAEKEGILLTWQFDLNFDEIHTKCE